MKNPTVILIITIIAAIMYIVSFIEEKTILNGAGAIVFTAGAVGAYIRYKKAKK